jgi:hypothetical protein
MKIHPVGTELLDADIKTDWADAANRRFSQFDENSVKKSLEYDEQRAAVSGEVVVLRAFGDVMVI